MRQKRDYLIWRAKNGFFTALDKSNVLKTWSMLSGKMLYKENCQLIRDELKKYDVYRSEKNDITYTQNFYR